MKILIYPEEYKHPIDVGPPTPLEIKAGCNWTPEDTEKQRKLAKQAKIVDVVKPPMGITHINLDGMNKNEIEKLLYKLGVKN